MRTTVGPSSSWAVAFLAGCAVAWVSAAAPAVRVVQELPLPSGLERARDLRWPDERTAWVAAGRAGTFALSLTSPQEAPRLLVESPPGAMGLHDVVARAGTRLWLGAPVRAVGWREVREGKLEAGGSRLDFFDFIVDIDAFADRVLVLGASRGKDDSFCPDGAIAWLGTTAGREISLRPVLFSSSGPGAANMDRCAIFGEGKVRFLADGSFLIVPGVEPGALLYDPEGRLQRTWSTAELGIDAGCALTKEDAARYSVDESGRYRERINQRVIVDEILDLPQGPGLVTRSRRDGVTQWELLLLSAAGGMKAASLPMTSPAERAHLRGDTRGGKALLLLTDFESARKDSARRLVVVEISP